MVLFAWPFSFVAVLEPFRFIIASIYVCVLRVKHHCRLRVQYLVTCRFSEKDPQFPSQMFSRGCVSVENGSSKSPDGLWQCQRGIGNTLDQLSHSPPLRYALSEPGALAT